MAEPRELSTDIRDKIVDLWERNNSWHNYYKMEEAQNDGQSPSGWGFMQGREASMIMRKGRDQPTTKWNSISWELGPQSQRNRTTLSSIKTLQRTQGPPAQASTRPGPSKVCQRLSGWPGGGMEESHVVGWVKKSFLV